MHVDKNANRQTDRELEKRTRERKKSPLIESGYNERKKYIIKSYAKIVPIFFGKLCFSSVVN